MRARVLIMWAMLMMSALVYAKTIATPYGISIINTKETKLQDVSGVLMDTDKSQCYGGLVVSSALVFKDGQCVVFIPKEAKRTTMDGGRVEDILKRDAVGDILCNQGKGTAHFVDGHSNVTEQELSEAMRLVAKMSDAGALDMAVCFEYPNGRDVCFRPDAKITGFDMNLMTHVIGVNACQDGKAVSFRLFFSEKAYSNKDKYIEAFIHDCLNAQ